MRNSRLDIRTNDQAKSTLEAAANILGTTTSAFVLEAAMKKAQNILKEAHTISLNAKGHERLMALMDNPPVPNEKLKALFR